MSNIKAIDEERRRLDLSQHALCVAAGIDPSTYVRLKKGRTKASEGTLAKLRNALAIAAQREAAE
ncbi:MULTISPECIES: helix-turn-helix domain-containing protein, partial [Pseudomonadota]|uniref:HTH cro/C1-type domain-containing protein n=1 Tax=Methylobacterium jeotgali TaxID=381630 RepID=A0ABQ4SV87_9HYPH